jgi:hypothetical protein
MKDLRRTVSAGRNGKELTTAEMEKMRRVLLGYSRRNGYLGYCQGMNFIVAKLIRLFEDEEVTRAYRGVTW